MQFQTKGCLTTGCAGCRRCLTEIKPMSGDNRTVHTDALATLGMIIDKTAGRDAIHLAVEPVTAGESIFPGAQIRLAADGLAYYADAPDAIGICDPFLTARVLPGQMFWLVVMPRTITSLRHVWEHPAFPPAEATAPVSKDQQVEKSKQWILDFISSADCPGYETLLAAAVDGNSWNDEYLHFDNYDAHGDIPDELYDHIEIVTGKKITNRPKYFSCSC